MATRDELISALNNVLAYELAGTIQYLHASALVTGKWRATYAEYFHDMSKESRGHAEAVANRIVSLGGLPTVEPAIIRQATDIDEMLAHALALEEEALALWEKALDIGDAVNIGTRLWIEEMISEEQEHVDELRKMTGATVIAASGAGSAGERSA